MRFSDCFLTPVRFFLVICYGLTSVTLAVQNDAPLVDIPGARERITAELKALEAESALTESQQSEAAEQYRLAQEALDAAADHLSTLRRYAETVRNAPNWLEETSAARQVSETRDIEKELSQRKQLRIGELVGELLQKQSELSVSEADLADLKKRIQAVNAEPADARNRLTQLKREQEELTASRASETLKEIPTPLLKAKTRLLESRATALEAEQQMLNQQLLTAPIRLELLEAQYEVQNHRIQSQRQFVIRLEELVNQRRLVEARAAEVAAEVASQEAAGKHPLLRDLADKNALLGARIRTMATELESVTHHARVAAEAAEQLKADFDSALQQVEVAGLSQVLGQALRERQRTLPDLRRLRKEGLTRESLIGDISLQQIHARDERRMLRPVEEAADRLLNEISVPQEADRLRTDLLTLLQTRLELLDKAVAVQSEYIRALMELDASQRRMVDTTVAYKAFLDEHLLWVRTTTPLSLESMPALPGQLGRLFVPMEWLGVLRTLAAGMVNAPLWLLPILAAVLLLWHRRRILDALAASGERLGKPTTDHLIYTLQAVGLTLLGALPWALLTLGLGYLLRLSVEATDFAKSVGEGLVVVAGEILMLETLRLLCYSRGLAVMHFRWSTNALRVLKRAVVVLMLVFIPMSWLTVFLNSQYELSAGVIIGFVIIELALAWFFYRVLNPKGAVLEQYVRRHASSSIVKLRLLWYPISILLPILFAGYVVMGYVYTSSVLTEHLLQSMWFVLALIIVHAIAVRWRVVTRRRLAYQAALERRDAMARATDEKDLYSGEVEVPSVDLNALDEGSRKLLNLAMVIAGLVGFYTIWSNVLPALGVLDRVELWQQTLTVDGEQISEPITVWDVGAALLIGLVAVILTKHLPNLIEALLLQNLKMLPGTRYAVTTLMGYLIAAVGVFWAFNIIGADWSKLQWLVAALGVGIGFGLQEIVANFISGLIILFERPIRVGDVVTVGDTDGIVTRIQIRATTIRNWDKKELLVPNKEFITARLLNWSLSDQVNRVMLNVGVAYDSDVDLALQILEQTAKEHPRVLEEPAPVVLFEGFGDNALNLSLRCYLDSLDDRLSVRSELGRAILRKFKTAGISIAFPQRDVHLDTIRPLEVRLQQSTKSAEASDPAAQVEVR